MVLKIPFNMSYKLTGDLRDVPENETEMLQGIVFLKQKFNEEENSQEKAYIAGKIGMYSRITGNLQQAEEFLRISIDNYRDLGNLNGEFINQLRLAHVYQYQKSYAKATDIFSNLMNITEQERRLRRMIDFVYQQFGQCLFGQGKYHEALEKFENALEIRIKKGYKDLVSSTEDAINITKLRLSGE